jgi:hypothetical protein
MLINPKKSKNPAQKPVKKTSPSPLTKPKSNQSITKTSLKEAYSLVINDLFNAFLKAKDNEAIRLDKIGTFTKSQRQLLSHLDGNHYLFYKMGFRMSRTLKQALDQQLQ